MHRLAACVSQQTFPPPILLLLQPADANEEERGQQKKEKLFSCPLLPETRLPGFDVDAMGTLSNKNEGPPHETRSPRDLDDPWTLLRGMVPHCITQNPTIFFSLCVFLLSLSLTCPPLPPGPKILPRSRELPTAYVHAVAYCQRPHTLLRQPWTAWAARAARSCRRACRYIARGGWVFQRHFTNKRDCEKLR